MTIEQIELMILIYAIFIGSFSIFLLGTVYGAHSWWKQT